MPINETSRLTDIVRQFKDIFPGFAVTGLQDEVDKFRNIYGDADAIRIGDMDYIVINGEYKRTEYDYLPNSISSLFFDSINKSYAIIDRNTLSTLIDEVYSRVTYMRRTCTTGLAPDSAGVMRSVRDVVGKDLKAIGEPKTLEGGEASGNANIFQCQLLKDTGVSSTPDTYSFMLKKGEVKEIGEAIMSQIRRTGELQFLKDADVINAHRDAIQQAVFDKYKDAEIEIQGVTVRSIFEIVMAFSSVLLSYRETDPPKGEEPKLGYFHTVYLPSVNDDFAALNASIHTCNCCGHDLVDSQTDKKTKLHLNIDALAEVPDNLKTNETVYALGCEECLVQCPVCGEWHFNYQKLAGTGKYDAVTCAPGREFIKGLVNVADTDNYCSCRKNVDWTMDEKSGDEARGKYNVIPVGKMVFINYANEKIAGYEEFKKLLDDRKKHHKGITGAAESKLATEVLEEFRQKLAAKFGIDNPRDIKVTSIDKCVRCDVCGGEYFRENISSMSDGRCDVCREMVSEKVKMLTRSDGVVFMCRKKKGKNTVTKYVMTKLGNLKKLS